MSEKSPELRSRLKVSEPASLQLQLQSQRRLKDQLKIRLKQRFTWGGKSHDSTTSPNPPSPPSNDVINKDDSSDSLSSPPKHIKYGSILFADTHVANFHPSQKIGDSGVWIIGGSPSSFASLIEETKLNEVEQALDFLANRKWTKQDDGLEAWAGAFYPRFINYPQTRSSPPCLSLAIRNVSAHDIYCPINALKGSAIAENGETLSLEPYKDGYLIFCKKLAPGKTMYIANGSFSRYFPAAKQGEYEVTMKYENLRDGEADNDGKPRKRVPVRAWTGIITPPSFKVSVDSNPSK